MDERRIEAALRSDPPDEPKYRGSVAGLLQARAAAADREEPPGHVVELVGPAPHRRRPWLALTGAVAAAAVLVVALAVVARPQERPPATAPTTTPSTAIVPAGLPIELLGRWVGATPAAVTTPNPSAPAFVVFDADRVALEHLAGGVVNVFNSHVTATAEGRLRLTLTDQAGRCVAGANGDYRWALSPLANNLTLAVISDECPSRADAFAGEWTHIACPVRGNDCLGPLEAGRNSSVNFDPFDSDSYGEVTYVVTDGWSSPFDDKTRLTLLPPGSAESGLHGLYLFADVAPTNGDCPATADTTADTTAVAAALSATPGVAVNPVEATVGAYSAQIFDLSTPPAPSCAGEQPLLTSRPGSPASWTLAIGEGQRMRIVLVDLPGEHAMAIVVASDRSAAGYTELLDTAAALIDSLVLSATP